MLNPSPIAGTYFGPMAGFGESLVTTGPLAGSVVLVNDGAGVSPTDGCEPFAVPPGSIPLMDRGTCNFTVKVKNAQNAGATIAIVGNNSAGAPTAMGGSDPTITIPSVMISLDDTNLFKAGGRTTVSCLNNAEQMGEGWSDWFGLTLTMSPSDTRTTPRGVGSYVSFQPADGVGIRPTQYTTDMSVNPSTYASVADTLNISQPHGIGYVWNTMLWEMFWNLVDRHGFNADIYGHWSTGGNNLAFQLVMDGMKFQPCQPGFVNGRNAILDADTALTGGAKHCEIWRGFAKRGLGYSASQGSSNNRTDGVEAFDLPAECTTATFGGFMQPVANAPEINSANAGQTIPLKFLLAGGGAEPRIDSQPVHCDSLDPTGVAPSTIQSPGASPLKIEGEEYHVNWQTSPEWAGTCRRLTVRLPAATDAVAYFSFR